MNVFLLASNLPATTASAAEAVLHEIVAGLLDAGESVTLQPMVAIDENDPELAALRARGLTVLSPLPAPPERMPGSWPAAQAWRLRRDLSTRPETFYPALALRGAVRRRIEDARADVAFVVWSIEGLAAAAGNGVVPTFVYYGVPDHMPNRARLAAPEVFDIPNATPRERLQLLELRRQNERYAHAHMRLIRECAIVSNLCAPHARWWAEQGHPDARYIPNLYPDRGATPVQTVTRRRLVGSTGSRHATGNALGLHYLVNDVLPALRRRGVGDFRIDLFGRGTAAPRLEASLAQPEIEMHGWVDDLDAEIRSSAAWLLFNNAGPYPTGYTRVLHAWSLRGCLIGHAGLGEAMPEVKHGENALLARTPDEAAELIEQALDDAELRERIGAAGRATYDALFRPAVVVPQLIRGLEDACRA